MPTKKPFQVFMALFSLFVAAGCGLESTTDKSLSNPAKATPQLCIVEYEVPEDFKMDFGQAPFEMQRETFCGWEANSFRTSFVSNTSCSEGASLSAFAVRGIRNIPITDGAGVCKSVEEGDLRHWENSKKLVVGNDRDVVVATIKNFDRDTFSVLFEVGYANQREGFPIKAAYYDESSIILLIETKYSPWGEGTCSSLFDHLKSKLPENVTWECQ